MKTTKPYYYDDFKCIADKCSDSCCIGWEIDIDPDTLKIYESEAGTLGKKLKKNIKDGSFVLTENERCPFLRKDNLCELICQKGVGYLCEICREHPRYYEFYGDYLDMGIGLCCEEACRLLFSGKPLTLITEGEAEPDEEIDELLGLREELISKLQIREESVQSVFFATAAEVFELWEKFEPFDNRWTETSAFIEEHFCELISKEKDFLDHIGDRVREYENLAIYLLHRHFMKALYTSHYNVIFGIAVYLRTQYLFDLHTYCTKGKFDIDDRIDTAKYISKQIEYSEENTAILFGEV